MRTDQVVTANANWEDAGEVRGARSTDLTYLFELYARPANEPLFDELCVGEGVRLLDVACGSGFAVQADGRRRAVVTGVDVAEALVGVSREGR